MNETVVAQLLALNREFYGRLAGPFSQSRQRPQPGFHRLLDHLPKPCERLLDVGCGDGRFGRFVRANRVLDRYTGVDFSAELLQSAADIMDGTFYQRDLSQPGGLADLGQFEAVACLAVLQHIPGRLNRLRLLKEMKSCLSPSGSILLSAWQFAHAPRMRRKIRPWSDIGLSAEDVEPGDFLMTWQAGGLALRYVAQIDEGAVLRLAGEAGLAIVDSFRSDGKEGDLNLYCVLTVASRR